MTDPIEVSPGVFVMHRAVTEAWLARDLALPTDTAQYRAASVFRALLDDAIKRQDGKR